MMITLCVVSQSAGFIGHTSNTYISDDDDDDDDDQKVDLTDRGHKINHVKQERSMSLNEALAQYNEAMKKGDVVQLYRSYRALCQISLRRQDYEKVFEYGRKAIELYPQVPQDFNLATIYALMYQASPDRYPYDNAHGELIEKMIAVSKTPISRFNALLFHAIYYARRKNFVQYNRIRQEYQKLGTPEYIHRANTNYCRAESYHYYFIDQKDSVINLLNKIRSKYERCYALMELYRSYGMYKQAMNYADSADKAVRKDMINVNNLTTAELQKTLEQTQQRIQEEKAQELIAIEESRQHQQMLENQRLQIDNEKAAGEKKRLLMEKKKRDRDLALEESKIAQRDAEAHRIEMERKANAEKQEHINKKNDIYMTYLIAGGMLVVLLIISFWFYSGIKTYRRLRQLTRAQQKAHEEALYAAESKNNFIASMSHDMKDPLQKVANYAKVLADENSGLSDDERMDIGLNVQEVGIKLLDYINKILDPSSVSSHPDHSTDEERISHYKSMHFTTVIIFVVFLFSLSLFSVSGYSNAATPPTDGITRNNPFSIDDVVFAEYSKAYELRHNVRSMMPVWNKAWNTAVSRNEKKGQCMLYFILMRAYEFADMPEELEQTVLKLRELSKRYGLMQYYYSTYVDQVDYYLDNNDVVKALHTCTDLQAEADATNNPYARYYLCKAYVYICQERDDPKSVVEWAEKALEAAKYLQTPQDISSLYITIYLNTPGAKQQQEGLDMLEKALSLAKTPMSRTNCYKYMAEAYYYRQDTVQFRKYLELYNNSDIKIRSLNNASDVTTQAMEMSMNGDAYGAIAMLRSLKSISNLKTALQMAEQAEYYKEALEIRDQIIAERQKAQEIKYKNDIASLAKYESDDSLVRAAALHKIEIERLAERKKELEVSSQRLALEQQQQQDEVRRLELENAASKDSLLMRSAQLARRQSETMANEARLRYEESELEQQQLDNYYTLGKVGGISVIVISVILLLLRLHNIYSTRQLQRQHVKLHNAYLEAVNAKKMKEAFIQNMSHEIRTPLNAILGFAQLLSLPADSFEKDERKTFAEHVDHNVQLLSMLIEDIVNIGDIEKGIYSVHITPTKINDVLRTAISTVEYRMTADVSLVMDSNLPDDFTVDTDGQRVMQVLINYLTNAIKHTVSGSINAKAAVEGEKLVFSVADTGTGVPVEQAENIFRRFVKLEEFVQGTGLGLNICLVIADNLHGRCYLDKNYPASVPGVEHGARFVFEIPLKQQENKV